MNTTNFSDVTSNNSFSLFIRLKREKMKSVFKMEVDVLESLLNEIHDGYDLPICITDSEESSSLLVFVSSKHKISEFRKILVKERNVAFVDSEQVDSLKDRTLDTPIFYVGMPVPPEEHDGPFCDGTRHMDRQTKLGCKTIDSLKNNAQEKDKISMKNGESNGGASACDPLQVPFVKMHVKGSLGKGASGECVHLTDGYSKDVAYKIIKKNNELKAIRQLETMVKFRGNGLPQIFTIKENDHFYEIFMELIFPCISMTELTKRLACIRNSVADCGRRFFHYFFYKLLGEIQKFHVKDHTHGDLGESKNESNILLQKTEVHSVAVRLIDPGDVDHRITIDLADISKHMCTIGDKCSYTEDPIFKRFINGTKIWTEDQAKELRQELSYEGEMFEADKVYSKTIIDVIFVEPKNEAKVQSLGNIRDVTSGVQGEKGDTGEPGPMGSEGPQEPVGPSRFRGPKGDIGMTGLPETDRKRPGFSGLHGYKGDSGSPGPAGPSGLGFAGSGEILQGAKVATTAQSDSQRVFVQQKYPADKLYHVTTTYTATDLMDLSVAERDCVGLIMDKDPMGNKDRWFIDNGAAKGFVPKTLLKLHSQVTTPSTQSLYPSMEQTPVLAADETSNVIDQKSELSSPHVSVSDYSIEQNLSNQNKEEDELDFALDEDMSPNISSEEFYYAAFPFEARNGNEISMFEGQVVTVLIKHDQENNTEWWYVDADGVKGYAPANYLQPMK